MAFEETLSLLVAAQDLAARSYQHARVELGAMARDGCDGEIYDAVIWAYTAESDLRGYTKRMISGERPELGWTLAAGEIEKVLTEVAACARDASARWPKAMIYLTNLQGFGAVFEDAVHVGANGA